jgi:hypothetical protein
MEQAITLFMRPPHNCRVFNLSLGSSDSVLTGGNSRQSLWGESLDTLTRKHKLLLVVSADNNRRVHANTPKEAEEILANYPRFLFEPACALSDPATAAIALTVGSISAYSAPATRTGPKSNDFARAVAGVNEPSPFTRVGPGINRAIKPDLVDYGGNLLFEGVGSGHRIIRIDNPDPGMAVMSLGHRPVETLFSYGVGTSYAAPRISRLAALTWRRLEGVIGPTVDPNLVRALLASTASVPEEARNRIESVGIANGVLQVCGYGLPDEDLALNSGDRRVTLVAQGKIDIDTILLYEIPMSSEFRAAPGVKRIVGSLAFDPPVRRRRVEYLGVEMGMHLFRGRTADEIIQSYKALTAEERKTAPKSIQGAENCNLLPNAATVESSTLQRCEWTFRREGRQYPDTYYLMLQARRNWAPPEIRDQSYGVCVTLVADEPRLYNLIQLRVRQRQRVRTRATRG